MAKNKDEVMDIEEMGHEPRVYELGFHLDPELPTEEVKKAFESLKEAIAGKGEIVAHGEPQKVPLAYTISRQETSGRRDFDSAYFSWIAYVATPENHAEVIEMAKGEKRIIRFIDLVTTKEAARHSVEMQELALKAAPTDGEGMEAEEAAVAELDAALESATI
jgi:ribosomal protein S6